MIVGYWILECVWNLMARGDAREGKWRGKLPKGAGRQYSSLPRDLVYPALLPLMRTPRLPVVDWTDAPADLNGLVRFVERPNLVTALVPSHFKLSLRQGISWSAGRERHSHIACISRKLPVPRNKRLKDAREILLPVSCQNEMSGTSLLYLSSLEGILSFQSIHSISTSTNNIERKSA